jgi:hypothetical protein
VPPTIYVFGNALGDRATIDAPEGRGPRCSAASCTELVPFIDAELPDRFAESSAAAASTGFRWGGGGSSLQFASKRPDCSARLWNTRRFHPDDPNDTERPTATALRRVQSFALVQRIPTSSERVVFAWFAANKDQLHTLQSQIQRLPQGAEDSALMGVNSGVAHGPKRRFDRVGSIASGHARAFVKDESFYLKPRPVEEKRSPGSVGLRKSILRMPGAAALYP